MKLAFLFMTIFAIIRIAGATNVFFKDAAHLFVGGLFGAAIVLWSLPLLTRLRIRTTLEVQQGYSAAQIEFILKTIQDNLRSRAEIYLMLALFLSIIETIVAVLSRTFA